MTRYALLKKLHRIKALEDGATTRGEAGAAAAAKERVMRRLAETAPEPIPQARQTPVGIDPIFRGAVPPDRGVLLDKLLRWRSGELSSAELWTWALRVVDKTLLSDAPPHHPESVAVEVVMALSTWRHSRWREDDVDALIVFLRSPRHSSLQAWRVWLSYQDTRAP